MQFSLRFNLRNPDFSGVVHADRYAAAIDMAEWADNLGAATVSLSEHHGSHDGILPCPLPVIAAMAARTKTIRLSIAALVAPFHDPIRLAEEIAVVDQISGGRLDIVIAAGHDEQTFEMFGVDIRSRARLVTEMVTTLRSAFSGDPFEFRGRTVRVTPTPCQPGGPRIIMGGNSEAAARRAARLGDGFVPAIPQAWEFYRDEIQRIGKPDPGPFRGGNGTTIALSEDPEDSWDELAPFFLYEAKSHGYPIPDADVLKESGLFRVLSPRQYVDELQAQKHPFPNFDPMCGGINPDKGWESLRLFEQEVLPKFA